MSTEAQPDPARALLPAQSVLRLYLTASDQIQGRPAADVVVETARDMQATLALVRPGIAGVGRRGREVNLLLLETQPGRMPLMVQVLAPDAVLLALLATLEALGLPDRLVVLEPGVSVQVPGETDSA